VINIQQCFKDYSCLKHYVQTKKFAVHKYSSPKYKYEYKYLVLKYEYKYKYLDLVLEYNSSTSTCTKYYGSSHFDRQGLYLLLFC